MARRGATWITNVHQGGIPEPVAVPDALARVALGAATVAGARFCGVDLMEDGAGGYLVLEVNAMPAWRGLQSVAGVDVAAELVDDWLGVAAKAATSRAARRRGDLADGVPVA
jgi:ribosomal protein S6--L-glutamate ligase